MAAMTARELTLGWIYLPIQLLLLPGVIAAAFVVLLPDAGEVWINFAFYVVNFLAILGIFREFLGKSLKTAGEKPWRLLWVCAVGLCVYWGISSLLRMEILRRFPDFANANDRAIVAMLHQAFWPVAVGTVLLVPVTEECLYRGLLFGTLARRSPIAAYCLSAAVFSMIHVTGYIGTVDAGVLALCFVQYLPAGLCLAWAYELTDTIFAPILIHGAINALGIWTVLR